MKKSVKFLAVLLIFLMPLSAFAESWWSPNRVRVNYRVGGSQAEGGLGAITGKYKCPDTAGLCTAYSIPDSTVLASMGAEDKESERVNGGLSIHYIMDMNILVGIHLWSTEYITLVTQTSDWTGSTAGGATSVVGAAYATQLNAGYGGAGTALAVKKSTVSINFLDVGYFYDMADIVGGMSVSGGLGLPLLGSSGGTDLVYGSTGYALNGGLWTESITADSGGSAMSYFADFGYAFGIHEALFSLRKITTEGSATVSETKGLGKVLGKSKFTSKGDYTSFFLGYGYIF
jgi:hypothetical protein